MRGWLARCVAASVLAAVLACSGLGVCWLQFAPRGHSCCDQDARASIGTASSCASTALGTSVHQTAPQAAPAVPAGAPAHVTSRDARAQALPARVPPLVLRI